MKYWKHRTAVSLQSIYSEYLQYFGIYRGIKETTFHAKSLYRRDYERDRSEHIVSLERDIIFICFVSRGK